MFKRILSLLILASPALAEAPSLALPVDCQLGTTCFIQQFVDRDPGPGATDFGCGTLSYDGHKGTDFALRNLADMARGVDVLAATPGRVLGVRDAMPDAVQGQPGAPSVVGKECGNGVNVDAGDGWSLQYCHLKRGSITVQTGDILQTGDVLGQIGLSGNTQFPHLHLSVRKDGAPIDPFDVGSDACGTSSPTSLWAEEVPTPPGGLISVGFLDAVPSYDAIRAGMAELPAGSKAESLSALVLWADLFGGRADDILRLTLAGPKGIVLMQNVAIERTQAQAFRAAGRRTPQSGWPSGTYSGTATLLRGSTVLDERTIELTLH